METPYDATFVGRLKTAAAGQGRWNPDKKVWFVPEAVLSAVQTEVKSSFGDYDFTPKTPTVQVQQEGAYQAFVEALGYEVCNLAYRKRASQLHTDVGGDNESIAKLNSSWQAIKGGLK